MNLALAAGMVSSAYLVLNNVGNLLYCLYVYDLPPGPIWAMQSFYLLSMGLLLRWYLRFTPRRRARRARPRYSSADAQPAEARQPALVLAAPATRR